MSEKFDLEVEAQKVASFELVHGSGQKSIAIDASQRDGFIKGYQKGREQMAAEILEAAESNSCSALKQSDTPVVLMASLEAIIKKLTSKKEG